MKTFKQFQEARLTADQRRALPNKDFALPGKGEGPKGKQAGSYPIPDEKHARSALSLVSQHGTPEEKSEVRAKVKKKFPNIQQEHHQKDAEGKVIEHGDGTPSSVEEDYYRGTGEKVVARTKKWMDKKGQKGAPGLDAMKARSAEHKAKRGVKEEVLDELKSTTLLSYSNKAANELAFKGDGSKKAQKRATGVKRAAGQLTMKAINNEEVVTELNRYGKETGKATGSLNKRAGTPVKKGGTSSPVMRAVRSSIRRETGRPEGQQKKEKGKKPPVAGEYGARRSPAQIVQNRRASKAAADAAMRDTRGT